MFMKWFKRIISTILILVLITQVSPLMVLANESYLENLTCNPQTGLSSMYEYETFDAGMAGTAYVNTYTGELHLRRSDLSLGGNRLPVSIEFYYDPANDNTTANRYGMGWSCTYNQKISYNAQTDRYAYKNENGTWIYFVNSGTVDEDGMEVWEEDTLYGIGSVGMELLVPASASNTSYAQVDLSYGDTHYAFDVHGRLVNITEGVNAITIIYIGTSDAILYILDPVGRRYCFNYTSTKLSSIVCKTSDNAVIESATIQYTVTDGRLMQVGYSATDTIRYAYNSNGLPTEIVGVDLCGYAISYDSAGKVTQVVSKAAMGRSTEASGYVTTFERSAEDQVVITCEDMQTAYTFDGCGRITNCELRQREETQAQALSSQYGCVYGYNLTYGYTTDSNGNVINTVTDVQSYDANGPIVDETEPEPAELETSEPEETQPDPYTYTYDTYGNVLSETYTQGDLHQTKSYTYSADGNYLLSQTDENGNTVQYQYNLNSGLLEALQDANQNETTYTYNALRELQSVQMDGLLMPDMSAQYTYTQGRLTKLVYGAYTYDFKYDIWGNILWVAVNGTTLVSYTYGANAYTGQVQSMRYGNGQQVFYTYNALGQVETVGYTNQTERFQYTYDADGALSQVYDTVLSEYTYYSENGFTVQNSGGVVYSYTSGEDGSSTEVIGDQTIQTQFTDDEAKRLTNAAGTLLLESRVSYDALDRLVEKVNETQLGTVTESYTYTTNANGSTGSLPASYSVLYVQGNVQNRLTYAYTYDANGNILSVTETLKEKIGSANETQVYRYTTSYTYDEAGQLCSVTDGKTGLTYQYQYDNSGNRTSQTVTASGQSTPQLSETFSYTNGILSGVAKSENGVLENVAYTSDRMGSILTRTVGSTTQTFTWGEGRMLLGVSVDASNNATYTYDASGLRRQKVVTANGQAVTTDFIWGNNGLVGFTQGDTVVTVLYDVENQPVGFTVNDAVYTITARRIRRGCWSSVATNTTASLFRPTRRATPCSLPLTCRKRLQSLASASAPRTFTMPMCWMKSWRKRSLPVPSKRSAARIFDGSARFQSSLPQRKKKFTSRPWSISIRCDSTILTAQETVERMLLCG